jgi:hypothetical protein
MRLHDKKLFCVGLLNYKDSMIDGKFDTWLQENDIERLWKVVHGELPEVAASKNEMDEFLKLVTHVAMVKIGGSEYQTSTFQ